LVIAECNIIASSETETVLYCIVVKISLVCLVRLCLVEVGEKVGDGGDGLFHPPLARGGEAAEGLEAVRESRQQQQPRPGRAGPLQPRPELDILVQTRVHICGEQG